MVPSLPSLVQPLVLVGLLEAHLCITSSYPLHHRPPVGDSDESPPVLPEQTSLIHALASQGWVCRNGCRSSRVRGRPVVTMLGYHGLAADHTDSCPEFLCCLFCSLISHHDLPPAVLTFHSQGLRNARWPSSMLHRSLDSEDRM